MATFIMISALSQDVFDLKSIIPDPKEKDFNDNPCYAFAEVIQWAEDGSPKSIDPDSASWLSPEAVINTQAKVVALWPPIVKKTDSINYPAYTDWLAKMHRTRGNPQHPNWKIGRHPWNGEQEFPAPADQVA